MKYFSSAVLMAMCLAAAGWAAEVKPEDSAKVQPGAEWFGSEMLRGSYLPMQPVNELGGRFFISYDGDYSWRARFHKVTNEKELAFFRNRILADVKQLKWLGVTDIIFWKDVGGERVCHDSSVPDVEQVYSGVDPLAELIRAATPEGLNVWAAWHSTFHDPKIADKYCAKDAKGNIYKYGKDNYIEDLLSPAYRERCHRFLDEYAEKYKPMGNFKGLLFYDEIWFTYGDFNGGHLPAIEKYCLDQFGEKPPADFNERLAKGYNYSDMSDVWRKRYLLFKQHEITDFWSDLVPYAHGKGLQVGVETIETDYDPTGWCWGMDCVALERLNADFYITASDKNASNSTVNPRMMRMAYVGKSWGYLNTYSLGGPGGLYVTFNQLWRLITLGNNPALPRELARHIHNQRQWANSEPLAAVAFLHNQNTLQMLLANAWPQVARTNLLFNALQRSQDADVIFTQACERYGKFRVLVAPPYAVRGLSEEVYAKLRQFVEEGGTILSVDADWSVSRIDLTQERDVTSEMTGVTYGAAMPAKAAEFRMGEQQIALATGTPRREVKTLDGTTTLAEFAGGGAAITEKKIGKGRVIALHFSADAEIEKNDNANLIACFASLVRDASHPAITAEGSGFLVTTTLKKGNWIAVALYPTQTPSVAHLSIDTRALGIAKDGFRLMMLGKEMEISRPGDRWGDTGFWTAEDLKKGFPVTIGQSDDCALALPKTFDLSDFTGKAGPSDAAGLESLTRLLWEPNTSEGGKRKRNYAHEIVVIAPGDEPAMPVGGQ